MIKREKILRVGTIIYFTVILAVLSTPMELLASDKIQWKPIVPRICGEKYILPPGAKEAVKNIKSLVAYNWGDLTWDPATVLNGVLFEQFTGIKTQYIGTPDEQMKPKLTTIFMAKSPAMDIVPLDATLYVDFAKAGWLEPLDFLWDEETWKHYGYGLREATTVDGHVYSVPQNARLVCMLYYRPSMLKAAGYDGPPKTWAERDEMIKKLTLDINGDGVVDQWGFAYRAGGVLEGAFELKSGSLLLGVNPDNYKGTGKIVWNSPETISYLEKLTKMRNVWKVVPPGVVNYEHADLSNIFLGGKLAMVRDYTYLYAEALDSSIKDDFAVALQSLPYEDAPRRELYHWNGWGVSTFSKKKPAAYLFCDYNRSRQASTNEFVIENNDFWMLDVLEDPRAQTVGYLPILKGVLKGELVTNLYANQGAVFMEVIRQMQKALLGEKTPKQAMDDAQKRINRIMNQKDEEINELLSW